MKRETIERVNERNVALTRVESFIERVSGILEMPMVGGVLSLTAGPGQEATIWVDRDDAGMLGLCRAARDIAQKQAQEIRRELAALGVEM